MGYFVVFFGNSFVDFVFLFFGDWKFIIRRNGFIYFEIELTAGEVFFKIV